jgi:hypothetical protein
MIALGDIDAAALGNVIWASLVAGIVIIGTFVAGLYGLTRSAELRRAGRAGAAVPYALLAAAGLTLFAAAVVIGFTIMINK